MIWAFAARLAAAALPSEVIDDLEIPAHVTISAEIAGGQWNFSITGQRTRTIAVAPPATEAERQALLALLESLLADLALPPAQPDLSAARTTAFAPQAAARSPVPAPQAEPTDAPDISSLPPARLPVQPLPLQPSPAQPPAAQPEPPAPTVPQHPIAPSPAQTARTPPDRAPEPSPAIAPPDAPASVPDAEPSRLGRLAPWLAVEGMARSGASLGVGGAFGAIAPLRSIAIGIGASLRPARALGVAPDASFREVTADIDLAWGNAVRIRSGLGISVRDYIQYDELVLRAATPRAFAGIEPAFVRDRWTLALGLAVDADLARISFDKKVVWFPFAMRSQIRIEFGGDRRTVFRDPDIHRAGSDEQGALDPPSP